MTASPRYFDGVDVGKLLDNDRDALCALKRGVAGRLLQMFGEKPEARQRYDAFVAGQLGAKDALLTTDEMRENPERLTGYTLSIANCAVYLGGTVNDIFAELLENEANVAKLLARMNGPAIAIAASGESKLVTGGWEANITHTDPKTITLARQSGAAMALSIMLNSEVSKQIARDSRSEGWSLTA